MLSRLPRWVTVLGILLALVVLSGGVALLVTGSNVARPATGGARTVVLKVEGGLSPLAPKYKSGTACKPDCDLPPAPGTASFVSYKTPAGFKVYNAPTLPFSKTVQVPVGGLVILRAAPGSDDPVTCSIVLNGRVLSQYTYDSDNGNSCEVRIPSGSSRAVTPSAQKRPTSASRPGMRRVTVRVGGLSLGDTLDYEAAVSAYITRTPYPTFTKDLWVRSGTFVMVHAASRHDPVTCSIAVDGRLLIQRSAAPWDGGLSAFCQAKIPSG